MANRQDFESKIIKMAWEDAGFKSELMKDPKAVIQRTLEVSIPENVQIKVVEENPQTYYLVLPNNPSESESDNQLNASAGGITPQTGTW